jgi:2-aminoethylphosphonate-pyruvate transaminase
MRPQRAIILAAGQGIRLRSVVDDRPKGLIDIGGEPMVGRSIRLLGTAGVDHITIVAGYLADRYLDFAENRRNIRVVTNDAFATTGSMASLALALHDEHDAVLVLESDIIYEARALTAILDAAADNATLVSGPTRAGDEVWVHAPDGYVRAMSKDARTLHGIAGEFVGITRLSASAADAMRDAFARFTAAHGHGRMDYETGGLIAVAPTFPIEALIIPDLCWGEIDDERQYQRVVSSVWPRLKGQA